MLERLAMRVSSGSQNDKKQWRTSRPVGYVLKRYPRLSETFVLNEIRALERAGETLAIFSILRPEAMHAHSVHADVRAPVTYFPATFIRRAGALAVSHAAVALTRPRGYVRALALALRWQLSSRSWPATWKHFVRAGYVANWSLKNDVRHLHAHFVNGPATVAQFAAIMCGIGHSFTAHAKDLYLSRPVAIRHRIKTAAVAVTCTRYNAGYLATFLSDEDRRKVHTVYHGIDIGGFPFRSIPDTRGPSPGEPPIVLSVGRLIEKKGFPDLIEACGILAKSGLALRCEIVGGGPLREDLTRLVARGGLEDVVVLRGAMPHDRLAELYARAWIFALPSRVMPDGDRDGIPNVLVEAMATGVPVISTPISGIPELIDHGRNGWLIGPNDPCGLAAAIVRLLGDRDTCERLARAARADVEERFDCWRNVRALQSLLGGRAQTYGGLPFSTASELASGGHN